MSARNQLLAQYDLHSVLFPNVLAGITDEESEKRLAPGINNVKWLAGHLVWSQGSFAGLAKVPREIEWLGHYDTQTPNPPGDKVRKPSLDEIRDAWKKYDGAIRKGLQNLTDEVLNSPFEFPLPQFGTVEGFWAFLNHHQAYTIGQIGILRRVLGKDAMKYR
jgi:hypothetical protein